MYYLFCVFWSADGNPGAVRAPGEESGRVVALEAFVVFEGEGEWVEVPDDDRVVLGPGGQPPSVRGPLGVPHLFAVVGQGLDGLARKVLLGALVVHRQEAGVDLERGLCPSVPVGRRGRQAKRRVGQA